MHVITGDGGSDKTSMPGVLQEPYKETDVNKPVDFLLFGCCTYRNGGKIVPYIFGKIIFVSSFFREANCWLESSWKVTLGTQFLKGRLKEDLFPKIFGHFNFQLRYPNR